MKAIKVRLPIYHFITKMTLDKTEYAKLRLYLKWIFFMNITQKHTFYTRQRKVKWYKLYKIRGLHKLFFEITL